MTYIRKASIRIIDAVKLMQSCGDDVNLCRFIRSEAEHLQFLSDVDRSDERKRHKQMFEVVLSELKTRPVEEVTRNLERLIAQEFGE